MQFRSYVVTLDVSDFVGCLIKAGPLKSVHIDQAHPKSPSVSTIMYIDIHWIYVFVQIFTDFLRDNAHLSMDHPVIILIISAAMLYMIMKAHAQLGSSVNTRLTFTWWY